MSQESGWAYVVGTEASGPKGSVQISGQDTNLDHDPNLLWSDDLNALIVSGNIIAKNFEIQSETKTVIHLQVSGSSTFGDTVDDLHQFTGSIDVTGSITANAYYGWGGDLEGIAINEYTNYGDNRLVTSVGEKSVNAEENLLFDGTLLDIIGNARALEMSASQVLGEMAIFNSADLGDLQVTSFTDGIISIQTGTLAGIDHLVTNTIEGTLTTPSQPNITQVGTLTTLNVANDATFNGTFYVKTADNRIGVNVSNPQATEEILSPTTQLRLTSQQAIFGIQDYEFTDLTTDSNGNFSISPSNGSTTINGNAVVTGDLVISGTLTARMTDFNVSADTLTFGDEATDVVIMNASTMTAPNGLVIDDTFYIQDGTIGVGDYSSGAKFEVTSPSNQFSIGTSTKNLSLSVTNTSTTLSTNNGSLDITSRTKVLNELIVGSNGDIILDNAGQLSSSVSVSSTSGYFTNLTSSIITVGNTSINPDSVETPTLTATNIGGTLTTSNQPNITGVGTLNSLSVSGDASFGLDVITINSTQKRVGVSKTNPQTKFEIKDTTGPQLRLTNSEYVFGISDYQYTDLTTTSIGDLSISPRSGKVIIPQLNLTNLVQGSANNFLSVDQNGNVILAPAVQSGIEVRNRVVVDGDYAMKTDDYFVGIQTLRNVVVTLPDAAALFNGQIFVIKDENENADLYQMDIVPLQGQLIENRTSLTLSSPGSAINIYTDGQSKFFIM